MSKDERPTITFEYIKSNDYKVYRIHGAYSSANAHGDLIMSLFSERTPIPRKTTHEITEDGRLVHDPINEEKKKSVIREVLFGISLNPDIARSVGEFFIEQANKLDKED
jgi:hypothetical protein